MQFHPTTLYPTGILITEGCRGEGAFLINTDGERFMERYAPNAMELASRDVVSRSEQTEIDEGARRQRQRPARPAPPRRREDPRPAAGLARAGDDLRRRRPDLRPDPGPARAPTTTWAASRPTATALTELPGLYAAGEVACVSVHGANRLGGNSLMETITFGRRAGRAAAEAALLRDDDRRCPERRSRDAERELTRCSTAASGERPWKIRDELGPSMLENFGVFRREDQMEEQIEIIGGLRERYEQVVVEDKGDVFNSDLTQALELGYLLDLAACMLDAGSRARRAAARTPARTTSRAATTRTSSSTRSSAGPTARRSHDWNRSRSRTGSLPRGRY